MNRPANRLVRETSPYLLQHAHNPVDWHPWGEEAFAKARAQDRPILLSVGYATCHWCHVMERESFEDAAIARVLAEGFVAIKVDREELPDVDRFYMNALQALSGGRGGWPMNLFLTPGLLPFFGGTYFPPQPRPGMASFGQVLQAVRSAWLQRRGEIEDQAQALLEHLRGLGDAPAHGAGGSGAVEGGVVEDGAAAGRKGGRTDGTAGGAAAKASGSAAGDVPASALSGLLPPASDPLHAQAVAQLQRVFDPVHGGFGGAPKFPQAPLLQYLLSLAALGNGEARAMLAATLRGMAAGGLYDHVSGGFARYSTDAHWQVPHFEKMLCDNAQLVRVYAGAWRLTGDARLRFVAEDTLAWMLREMRPAAAPAALGSAQDADAEGEEGRFHVWSEAQFREVLGADADAAVCLYGVTPEGNWEPGRNVLARRDPDPVRRLLGLDEQAFAQWERSVRDRLYAVRAQRAWPLFDDKVLADWNGLALRALAEAGRLFGRADLVQAAAALAEFLLDTMAPDGRLRHAWRNGVLRGERYLADHAQVGLGLVELHAASGDPRWLHEARALCGAMIESFLDPGRGLVDGEAGALPLRDRDRYDGALPSGSAAACELLLRLAGVFDRGDWRDLALQTLQRDAALLEQAPMAAPAMLHARLLADRGAELAVPVEAAAATEVVDPPGPAATAGPTTAGPTTAGPTTAGPTDAGPTDAGRPAGPAHAGADTLLATARSAFAPLVTLVSGPPDALPLLQGRSAGQAYLCRHGSCGLPACTAQALLEQLGALQR